MTTDLAITLIVIAAFVSFLLAAIGVVSRINLTALGLALLTGAYLVGYTLT